MLTQYTEGPLTIFKMGRSIGNVLLFPVHAFLIDDLLIDTGTSWVEKELLSSLRDKSITRIVNSHHHEDHIGNNKVLQDQFNVQILAHDGALPYLADPGKLELRWYQRVVWDWPAPSQGTPVGDVIKTQSCTFDVIRTVGHSPDHICLYEPQRKWLFTGDLFCGRTFLYLRKDEDYCKTLSTLKKLARLDIDILLCSLKGIVKDGKNALVKKIAAMESLHERVISLHGQGLSPVKIRRELLGLEGPRIYITGGHYSKQNTVDSIIWEKRPDQL